MNTAENKEWLTPNEVAELLQVSGSSVRVWCRQGKIECRRVGGRWRIARRAVES